MPSARGSRHVPRARGSLRGAREAARPLRGERLGARWLWLAPRPRTAWRSPRLSSIARSAVEQSAVATGTHVRDREVEVLASPLDPAGSIRVHVVANGARRVLGDRARRLARLRALHQALPLSDLTSACREIVVRSMPSVGGSPRELAGLFEEHAKQHARFEGRGSARDGCGSRRDRADGVAIAASALCARAALLAVPERRGDCCVVADREVQVLAAPLDPAGSIRVHVVANSARWVLGDRVRRPLVTVCIA